jgi:hypothetical protein
MGLCPIRFAAELKDAGIQLMHGSASAVLRRLLLPAARQAGTVCRAEPAVFSSSRKGTHSPQRRNVLRPTHRITTLEEKVGLFSFPASEMVLLRQSLT